MKKIKLGTRVVSTASDLTPAVIPGVGAALGAGSGAVSFLASMSYEDSCTVAAKVLHYFVYKRIIWQSKDQAYKDRSRARVTESRDIADSIVKELLKQRGISRVANIVGSKRASYDAYMAEPGGWLVLKDKIHSM